MLDRYNEFCKEALLDMEVQPWRQRRRNGKIYGRFLISGEARGQWFSPFVGLEFTAEIVFDKNEQGKRRIKEVVPVRMTGRDVIRGREIPGNCISMI